MSGLLISEICGGLGNAMFMSLVGKTLAKKTGREFAQIRTEPKFSQRNNDYQYFTFLMQNGAVLSELPTNIRRINQYSCGGFNGVLKQILETPSDVPVYVSGYFSEEIYFDKDICDQLFHITTDTKQSIIKKYDITDDMVHVCVRRGDYVRIGCALDFSWYDNIIKEHFNGSKLAINSEDIEWCKEKFHNYDCIFLENSVNPMETLLTGACFSKHILSNSTFAFWQGYLSEPNEIVYCPAKWKYSIPNWVGVNEIIEQKQ